MTWWSRLRSSGTARSAATLTIGTIAAQGLNAGVSPVLTRLFTPTEFGQLGLFTAFLMVASVVLALRYDTAIPISADEMEAARLTSASALIVLATSVAAAALYGALIAFDVVGYGALSPWTIALMLVALLALGGISVMRYWHLRQAQFRRIAALTVYQSLVRAALQIGLGAAALGSAGLIIGETIGRATGAFTLAGATIADLAERMWGGPTQSTMAVLRRYRNYLTYGVPSSLLNALALYLPIPLVIALYGPAAGGWVLLVQRVISAPLAVVGSSIADVYHSRIAAESRERGVQIPSLLARYAAILFAIGIVPAAILIALAPPAFAIAFGEPWRDAGDFAVVMAPWALAQFVAYPISRTVLVLEAQRAKLLFDAASLTVVIGSLVLARHVLGLDALGAIGLLGMLQAWLYAGLLGLVWRVATSEPRTGSGEVTAL